MKSRVDYTEAPPPPLLASPIANSYGNVAEPFALTWTTYVW